MEKPKIPDDLEAAEVHTRRAAAEYLSRHDVDPPAILALIRTAGDPDEQVREWAVAALEAVGPPGPENLDELLKLLDAQSEDTAFWSATMLGRLGPQAAPAAVKLGAVAAGQGPLAVRQRAAWALEKIGPAAEAAVPALRRASESDDPRLARQARRAMNAIGDA